MRSRLRREPRGVSEARCDQDPTSEVAVRVDSGRCRSPDRADVPVFRGSRESGEEPDPRHALRHRPRAEGQGRRPRGRRARDPARPRWAEACASQDRAEAFEVRRAPVLPTTSASASSTSPASRFRSRAGTTTPTNSVCPAARSLRTAATRLVASTTCVRLRRGVLSEVSAIGASTSRGFCLALTTIPPLRGAGAAAPGRRPSAPRRTKGPPHARRPFRALPQGC